MRVPGDSRLGHPLRIVSCNPLELKDPDLPPTFCGLPVDDRSEWDAYRTEYRRASGDLWAGSTSTAASAALRAARGEFIHSSPLLNLYIYPPEVDYPRSNPLGPTWHNLGSSVRTTDPEWSVPSELAEGDGGLVYLSLGSLGSGDVPLMERLVEVLGSTRHRFVVSKAPNTTSTSSPTTWPAPSSCPRPRCSPTWTS